jgi:hypothetical protein
LSVMAKNFKKTKAKDNKKLGTSGGSSPKLE